MALSVVAMGALVGCGGGATGADAPTSTLGRSLDAQTAFRPISARWGASKPGGRAALEADLTAFRERYASDELARSATAMLAVIAVDRGDLARADALAAEVEKGRPGSVEDMATVVRGLVQTRRGAHEAALKTLEPLLHKLIDPDVRAMLNEGLVAAALRARRFQDAVRFMEAWLRESTDRQATRAHIRTLLVDIPAGELARFLELRSRESTLDVDEKDGGIPRLVARFLADLAEERGDAALAKRLLSRAGAMLGDKGDRVAQLAESGGSTRVAGPTVGLLLPLRSDETRREGIEVAAGIAHGLGLPGSAARLVSRDDGGSLEQIDDALSALSADGAAVIIAGFDLEGAEVAARFAAAKQIPILLVHPAPATTSDFVFNVGEDPAAMSALLAAALIEHGSKTIHPLGLAAPADPEHPCTTLPPGLSKVGTPAGLILLGPPGCARDVIEQVATTKALVRLAAGLDVVGVSLPSGTLTATAGLYPPAPEGDGAEASLKAWWAAHGAAPSYFTGLGHDAGVLAWEGVRGLPGRTTEDPREVKAWRKAARDALRAAEAPLWTTDAQGFEGGNELRRTLGVVEVR